MRKPVLHIIILFLLFSCKDKKTEVEQTQISIENDSLTIEQIIDSVKTTIQSKQQISENTKEIGIVYVTAESGLTYRTRPDINSEKLGKFELGSKLSVIEKTGIELKIKDEHKNIKGEWIKVSSKRHKWHKGYVFSGFVIDSTKADFSITPIDVTYNYNLIKNNSNELKIKYEDIDLKFVETTHTEFNKYKVITESEKDNISEIKPSKSVGNPQQGGYFILKIKNRLIKFPCGENYSRPCFIYEGFNKYFNSYHIGHQGSGVYETFYIDKDDGSRFSINSPYDDGNYIFSVSPKNKKLVSFSSIDSETFKRYYDSRSVMTIYDINNVKSFSDITKAYWYTSKKWEISNLVWVNDKSFILEVYDKTKKGDNGMNIPIDLKYLRTTLN